MYSETYMKTPSYAILIPLHKLHLMVVVGYIWSIFYCFFYNLDNTCKHNKYYYRESILF